MSTITTGRHTVTVTNAEVGESKKKGTPGVFFSFKNELGETIDGELWLTEKSMERNLNTLRETFGFDDNFDTIAGQCVGKQCSITVELEADDNGNEWPRVKWINPLRTANAPASGGLLARLSAQAKRIARPAGLPAPSRSAPVNTRPAADAAKQNINDEDVPF